jgi:hypothetical protein
VESLQETEPTQILLYNATVCLGTFFNDYRVQLNIRTRRRSAQTLKNVDRCKFHTQARPLFSRQEGDQFIDRLQLVAYTAAA